MCQGPLRSLATFTNDLTSLKGFLGGSDGKEFTCNEGDLDSIPGLGRSPGGGHGNRLKYTCLENPHGQRSPAGYSPRGCKETGLSDLAQQTTHAGPSAEVLPKVLTCISRMLVQLRCAPQGMP